jgi:hypothetical protein
VFRVTIIVMALVLWGFLGSLLGGCQTKVTQPPVVIPISPDSPENLVTLFRQAYSTRDITLYSHLVHPDFKFLLQEEDVSAFDLFSSYFARREEIQAAANLFSGLGVPKPDGATIPAVTGININTFKPVTEWLPVDSSHPHFPNSLLGRFVIDFTVTLESKDQIRVSGSQDFYIVTDDSTFTDGTARVVFKIIGQDDISGKKEAPETMSWSELKIRYLTSAAPVAIFSVSPTERYLGSSLLFDASATHDPDNSSGGLFFRWRFDGWEQWTTWTSSPNSSHTYDRVGAWEIQLQARDAWNNVGAAAKKISVVYRFPSTPDQAIENLQEAYRAMDLSAYQDIIQKQYHFYYTDWDIQAGEDIPEYHGRKEEMRIHEHMFSGRPHQRMDGGIVPGISQIDIALVRNGLWEVETSGRFEGAERAGYQAEISFHRPGATTLLVSGPTEFLVVARYAVHNGPPMLYWQVVGQIDQTGPETKTETRSWGAIKYLYR